MDRKKSYKMPKIKKERAKVKSSKTRSKKIKKEDLKKIKGGRAIVDICRMVL